MLGPNYKVPWQRVRWKPVSLCILLFVRGYQLLLSPLVGRQCRHIPSCSNYMLEAVVVHGAFYGAFLGMKRILKCGPKGSCGYDPVPQFKDSKA
ncbi:MAG: membrane protein insertion efficiency factor YidD [Alphaproteobacteria bacterium]|nr:membrane protein insertion efficiency factor YidD [Alphaproteobacteria bacterium]MDD9919368.1 membrane protein insertion efficiency factor YidD [Alphaproteobacteria bacterium]